MLGDAASILGCTFRLLFRFLGCRNPVQDSCSGRILAESGRSNPDVPPFLGPEPFSRFGPESILIYLTRIRSCTCVGALSYQHVNENYFPPLQKNEQSTSIANNITSSKKRTLAIQLHHKYGAPQHHPPMPPTKATGAGIKQNRCGCPIATPLSTSGYSGVVQFGWARERRHRLMGCIFWAKFGRRGV